MEVQLGPRTHALLDMLAVVVFAVSPSVFSLDGAAAALAYALAVLHLAMTLATRFSPGIVDVVPFRVHGIVEAVVGVALVAAPWVLGDTFAQNERIFFSLVGLAILGVWMLSDYRHADGHATT